MTTEPPTGKETGKQYLDAKGVCFAHSVHFCEVCFTDELGANPPVRQKQKPIPRNLRKPTEGRCHHWWIDFCAAWRGIGHIYAVKYEFDDVLDEVRNGSTERKET